MPNPQQNLHVIFNWIFNGNILRISAIVNNLATYLETIFEHTLKGHCQNEFGKIYGNRVASHLPQGVCKSSASLKLSLIFIVKICIYFNWAEQENLQSEGLSIDVAFLFPLVQHIMF